MSLEVRNHCHRKTPHMSVCSPVDFRITLKRIIIFHWQETLSCSWQWYDLFLLGHNCVMSSLALSRNTSASKQIVTHQVSLEARDKFLKERKTFKVTATVLLFLILCYLPSIIARTLISYSVINSVNFAYVALSTGLTTAILNSLVNPIIYCVRIAAFRVAFIQLMSGKKPQTS